jgi:ABC-type transport system, involved in lipoprotein release, permease component
VTAPPAAAPGVPSPAAPWPPAPAAPSPAPPRATGVAWLRSLATAIRMARRDAARHWVRTGLATTLVALPMAALVGGTVLTQSDVPARQVALASIPDGVQAVITTTALPRTGAPFPQLPEGPPGPWVDDLEQVPASDAELAARLPAGNRLLPYWNSPELIATSEPLLAPGDQAPAGTGAEALARVDLTRMSAATLQEAGPEALALLLPELATGQPPADPTETVVTTDLADRLGVAVGDTITFVAPPHHGWYSTDGRIAEVIQNSQRAYRIAGLVDADGLRAWAPAGWISAMVTADPAGVDGHWLVVGDEPVTWDHVRQINHVQAFAVSRHVLENYPSADELYPSAVDTVVLLNRLVLIVTTGVVGALLVLFLVTPAFSVATEQSRRTLGLAAAAGATPADLRRIVTTQGLVVGLAGGLLGSGVGAVAGVLARRALSPESAMHFPWWIVPVAIGTAALLGVVATLLPAGAAARLVVVEAIKDRPSPPGPGGHDRQRWSAVAGPLVLVVAMACAGLSLSLPLPDGAPSPESIPSRASTGGLVILVMLTLVLAALGLVLCVRPLVALTATLARHLPVTPRLALRDANDHRSRFLPAAIGVLVAVGVASFYAVAVGSFVANERDRVGEMVGDGGLVLGATVPVSDAFDRRVLTGAVDVLARHLPVTGHEPVYAVGSDSAAHLTVLMPADRSCPDGLFPDTASAIAVGAPLHCVDWERAYVPGLAVPWWRGTDVHVMDGAALRASGLPGAEEAAAVLDRGGAVVNNAAMLAADGTVRVAISAERLVTEAEADRIVTLPGAFVRGFAPPLTVSPATARALGVTEVVYVGEYVVAAEKLSVRDLDRAVEVIDATTTLVWVARPVRPYPWGDTVALIPIALLAAVAVAATAISLALARTQTVRDHATMHAVGATPRFLARFMVVQAAVVLAVGAPLGVLAGIALGAYLVAWNRRTGVDGAWLETVPLWGVQAGLLVSVVGVGLILALVIARPPRALTRRFID